MDKSSAKDSTLKGIKKMLFNYRYNAKKRSRRFPKVQHRKEKKTNSKETEEETRKRNFKKNSVRVVHDLKTRSLHNSFRTVWSCYKKNYCGFTWRVEKVTLSNLTNQTNKFREPVTKKRKYMRTVLSLARENACDQVTIGSASSSDWLRIWCAVSKRITQ